MTSRNYFMMSMLPALGDLDSLPPMTFAEFLAVIGEDDSILTRLVETVLISDDLTQYQAVMSGELQDPSPSVMTVLQVSGQEPLPEWLAGEPRDSRSTYDQGWETYFRFAAGQARCFGSEFLRKWIGYEVGLRNELVYARSKALDMEPSDFISCEDLAGDDDVSAVVSEWAGAANPLAGMRLLDEARWEWIAQNDSYFSFGNDEVLAWSARLMLLQRWQRLNAGAKTVQASA